jgi:NAD(P)-dependent dehydrogenase (short-subunit alcohol dehydrogenase family)
MPQGYPGTGRRNPEPKRKARGRARRFSRGTGKGTGTGIDRTVLISGCSTGIGRASAAWLGDRGWRVFATVRRQSEEAELAGLTGVTPLLLDVTDEESIERARATVAAATGGGLGALVNNAGIAVGGALETVPRDDLRRILEVNVIGQVALSQAFLPLLRASGGKIVFVGSLGGRVAFPYAGPYHASKFAIEALGDSLRAELRAQGISVSIVEPATISTPIWSKARAQVGSLRAGLEGETAELYDESLRRFQERLAAAEEKGEPPEKVARVIAEALESDSPAARYRVGRGAGSLIAMRALVPAKYFDRLLRRALGASS